MKLSARLTHGKASRRIDPLKLFPQQGRVGHRDLESLIGMLGFSQTSPLREVWSMPTPSSIPQTSQEVVYPHAVSFRDLGHPLMDIYSAQRFPANCLPLPSELTGSSILTPLRFPKL